VGEELRTFNNLSYVLGVENFTVEASNRVELFMTSEDVIPIPSSLKTIFGVPPKEVILFFLHLMEPASVSL
jgi:hypothetical protein